MLLNVLKSQLVLVDYQQRLMPVMQDAEPVVANAIRLAKLAQLFGVPCWGTEQNPARLGENEPTIRQLCRQTVAKQSFSALQEDVLGPLLLSDGRQAGAPASLTDDVVDSFAPFDSSSTIHRRQVLLAGCETHVCLLQTALDVLALGLGAWVVVDACSSRTHANRDAAFTRLASAGAMLVTTEMVAFEWCRSAANPRFKDVLALVK